MVITLISPEVLVLVGALNVITLTVQKRGKKTWMETYKKTTQKNCRLN